MLPLYPPEVMKYSPILYDFLHLEYINKLLFAVSVSGLLSTLQTSSLAGEYVLTVRGSQEDGWALSQPVY